MSDTQIKNFEDLYNAVSNLLLNKATKVKGIGHLTVYDIALNIGYIRESQILPDKKIYLFRGALLGANYLLNDDPSLFNLPTSTIQLKEGVYDINIFKAPLSNMPSMFLEDMFCVFHREFKKGLKRLNYRKLQNVSSFFINIQNHGVIW